MKNSETTTDSAAATTGRPALSVFSSIHQGTRDYQEDACGHWFDAQHQRLFVVVADGAGGHGGGAEASQAAIESSAKFWKQFSNDALADPPAFLTQWMEGAHRAVNEAAAKIHRSARSVVVACLTDGRQAHWVHAGDSRLLRFHKGKLVERTRDDSVVQVIFERGEITEEEMGTHPDQSRLLQSLGGEDAPSPRLGSAELEEGDVLILCSDGFWEHLKTGDLEQLAATPPAKRQHALDQAVAEAVRRANAKADNTSAVMITLGENKGRHRPVSRWVIILIFAALVACAAGWWRGGWSSDLGHLLKKIRAGMGQSTPSMEPIVRPKVLESATTTTKNPPAAPSASEAGPSSGEVTNEPQTPVEQKP